MSAQFDGDVVRSDPPSVPGMPESSASVASPEKSLTVVTLKTENVTRDVPGKTISGNVERHRYHRLTVAEKEGLVSSCMDGVRRGFTVTASLSGSSVASVPRNVLGECRQMVARYVRYRPYRPRPYTPARG